MRFPQQILALTFTKCYNVGPTVGNIKASINVKTRLFSKFDEFGIVLIHLNLEIASDLTLKTLK